MSHKKMPPPKEMIRKLHWWSEERFGIKLKDLGDALLHGMQDTPVEHIEPNTDGKNAKLARRQADNANIILTRVTMARDISKVLAFDSDPCHI